MALNSLKIKAYLKVEHTADDDLIKALLLAATLYIKNVTGKTENNSVAIEDDPVFQLGVKLLCAHWYENRGIEIPGSMTKISYSLDAIINHISVCGEYE